MMTAFLTYLFGFFVALIVSYLMKMKESTMTIGDLITVGVVSLGSWASVTFYMLVGVSYVINSLPFDWLDIEVLSDDGEEV